MLMTKVPGMAGTSIQSPDWLRAWSPFISGGESFRRKVHQPEESLCGPAPCIVVDGDVDGGTPGYWTSFRRCWSDRKGKKVSGGRESASATRRRKRSPGAVSSLM